MRLVDEKSRSVPCKVLGGEALGTITGERMRILECVSKVPKYPAEIARELGISQQTLYYHVRVMEKAGLLEFESYEERNGAVAKKYRCAADSFAAVVRESWQDFTAAETPPAFFAPFIRNGAFEGKMVVGSPDPHGKYRARASELGVLELGMLLGRYCTFSFPAYVLDTQFRQEHRKTSLILAGGPKVNTVVEEVNPHLPIRFSVQSSELYSRFSKKSYSGNVGTVQLVKSPYSSAAHVLVAGGLNHFGTRAAILAMLEKRDELCAGNRFRKKAIAAVVEGFDEDGDGAIDAVEILE